MAIEKQSQKSQKAETFAKLRIALLKPLLLNDPQAAVEVLQRRSKASRRWQTDHSHFSTLSLDVCSCTLKTPSGRQQLPNRKALEESLIASEKTISEVVLEESLIARDRTASEVACKSTSGFFSARAQLLGFRALVRDAPAPAEVMSYELREAEEASGAQGQPGSFSLLMRQQSEPAPAMAKVQLEMPRQISAYTERPDRHNMRLKLPSPSANAYRPSETHQGGTDLKRSVQSLLNKICPENVAQVANKIAAIHVQALSELEAIIELVFKKAVTEPHYCETYADLVFSLKAVYPSFPCPDGKKPVTFKGLVLNICQKEFEELLSTSDTLEAEKEQNEAEELEVWRKKRKDRMRAIMKFIGHLFLRQLLSFKVIGNVICELCLCTVPEMVPDENALECACELLLAVGYTMESMPAASLSVASVCLRLQDLKSKQSEHGKPMYSKRVQFMIQDVLDTRAAGWQKKAFHLQAKTKEEIRFEQERDMADKVLGKESSNRCVITGQRPAYLTAALTA